MRAYNLCLDPISINSVFVMFRVSLFAINHFLTFSRSWLSLDSMSPVLSPAYVRWVSSAYIHGTQFVRQFGRSLIYSKNNNGPKIVP